VEIAPSVIVRLVRAVIVRRVLVVAWPECRVRTRE